MKTENRFISILSDYGFKVTFADEIDTLFLRRSLQALIQSKHKIEKIKFSRNEIAGFTKQSRGALYDLICEDEKGQSYIVEMQFQPYDDFIQRAKFYAFQRFNTLVKKGPEPFSDLKKIYCISILAQNNYPNSEQYYHFSTLKNQVGEEIDNQITHVFVEISKFDKREEDLKSDLDKFLYLMKNLDNINESQEKPNFFSEDWIDSALQKLDKSKMTPTQRMFYEMTVVKNATIDGQRIKEMNLAIQKNTEEVTEKVTGEVTEKVTEEMEKKAAEKAIQTAKTLKLAGVELTIIAEATGLSVNEIKNL